MEFPNLAFFVTSAYGFSGALLAVLLFISLWRARRAKRTLADLEREDA